MSYEDVKKKLDAKLNREEVSTRQNGGYTLSYVGTHYVISKLNEILGQGNWGYHITDTKNVFTGTIDQRGGTVFAASYIVSVNLCGRIGGVQFDFEDYGYGDGTDKLNPGKAHELAIKEAVTDGLKRCAKNLGPVMGLALYDKEQNDVEETQEAAKSQANPSKIAAVEPIAALGGASRASVAVDALLSNTKPAVGANPKLLKSTLKSAVKVLIQQGKMTAEGFTKDYAGNKKVDEMEDVEVMSTYVKIKNQFTELKLQ